MKKILFVVLALVVAIALFGSVIFLLTKNKDKGALQVTAAPASKVYLNDKLVGQSPLYKCELKDMIDEGSYTIKLVPTTGDFQPFEQKITISPVVGTSFIV